MNINDKRCKEVIREGIKQINKGNAKKLHCFIVQWDSNLKDFRLDIHCAGGNK